MYCAIHRDHKLNFALFPDLLDKLIKPLQTSSLGEEDVKVFWGSTRKLLPSCFATIRKVRRKCSNEKVAFKQLLDVLKIISKILNLEAPEGVDLFPTNLYGWLSYKDEQLKNDIKSTLFDAVMQGANDWFDYLLENNAKDEANDDGILLHLIKIVQLVRADLQKAIEYYDKMFQE